MEMKGKLKRLVTSILILLTISLGTGFLTSGSGVFANNSYSSSLGLIYALNTITQNPQNTGLGIPNNPNYPVQSFDRDIFASLSSIQNALGRAFKSLELQKMQGSES
jgi:hypothetical protein